MINKATPGIVVSDIGKTVSGRRGIVVGSFWLHRQLWISVRWESGMVTDEAPGSLSVVKGVA